VILIAIVIIITIIIVIVILDLILGFVRHTIDQFMQSVFLADPLK